MRIHTILIAIATLIASPVLHAEERMVPTERRLDPNSPDIVGQFHQIGLPKNTDIEKQIIDRAQKLQDRHGIAFNKVEIGKSVLEYPGLIAMGAIRHDPRKTVPYTLTIGIRPHLSEFAESFREYLIEFDDKGVVLKKTTVRNKWDKEAEQASGGNGG